MDQQMIEETIEYVKKVFEEDYSGHDFLHTLRVCKMATAIAEQEHADGMIVQLVALLHDVSPETIKTICKYENIYFGI